MSEACSNQKKGPIRGPHLHPQQYGISKRSCYLLCKMKAVNATDGPLNTKYLTHNISMFKISRNEEKQSKLTIQF